MFDCVLLKLGVIAQTVWKLYYWNHIKGETKALEAGRLKLLLDVEARLRLKAKEEQDKADQSSSDSDESDSKEAAKKKKGEKKAAAALLKAERATRRELRVKRKADAEGVPKVTKTKGRPKTKPAEMPFSVPLVPAPAVADVVE